MERVHSPGLAHISYVLGDAGRAAVIDPRRDCDVYVAIAREQGARITHIFETHRNEDYAIGSVELAQLTGARIYHGSQLPFTYGNPVAEGDSFDLGSLRLTVLSTPGHTDESISITMADLDFSQEPLAVFTGDVLFVGDVGRTDFFPDRPEEVAGLLYDSIFAKLLPLGDHVLIYPAHGAGSVCGAHMASREVSTIGYERRHNRILQMTDRDEFVRFKVAEHHYIAPYFRRMEKYNLEGTPPASEAAQPEPCTADDFAASMEEGMLVVDVRDPEAFGGGHIPGSFSIPLDTVPVFAGYLLPYDQPIGLVVEYPEQARTARQHLLRIGYDHAVAYLHNGMHAWQVSGREFETLPQVHVGKLKDRMDRGDEFALLDVRSKSEFDAGHPPGAVNIYVGELPQRLAEVPAERPITCFCGSGIRAMVAASVLRRNDVQQVENCLGSMMAWAATGGPIVTED
ncbi:MAG: rhodanese-like domain-containing protein [Armatimonadota bacterium]